ncbi:MAG TPA: response regulator [Methylomirabilota bacterium]|nr:response regulator [Methylomirabilota bacterium]
MTDHEPSAAPVSVLVIEDELPIRRFLRAALRGQGYAVVEAETGRDGIAQASGRVPDLVLLDLGLPDMDGFEVLHRIREWSALPVLVLTARGLDADKVRALDAGADDYVTKPFSMPELLARMRAALRRRAREGHGDDSPVLELDAVRIDLAARRVSVAGRDVPLTPIEFRLLATLARHPGRVLTHDALLREVWGPAAVHEHHYLRVYMAQLRRKLEEDPARPRILLTELGVGYRLREP